MKDETRNAQTGTLLDQTTPITMDDLKRQFQSDDFSAADSGLDVSRLPPEKEKLYVRAKRIFSETWEREVKKLGGKNGKNRGADYPLKVLEESESDLVAGTVIQIMESPNSATSTWTPGRKRYFPERRKSQWKLWHMKKKP